MGAGDRAVLRPAAMGIWIIHSAHFINIIMEETERAERERERAVCVWRTGVEARKAGGIARQLEELCVQSQLI